MAKKRIHQIAKELDIASADVLHKAKELGFEVKTASSGLVPEDEELLKLAFAEESSEQEIEEDTNVEINEEATLTEEDKVIEKDETIDEVILDEDTKSAKVIVKDSQLSLAIGKEGQNARLAAKLTGYKIDIEGLGDSPPEEEEPTKEEE